MDILQRVVELVLETIILVETTPLSWQQMGFSFFENITATLALYTVRLMAEASLIRLLGYGIGEAIIIGVKKLSPTRYATKLDTFLHRPKPAWLGKQTDILKRLGYLGLFLAGWIPIPVVGMSGPIIYNLERLHKPWYRFDNFAFACLLGGGLMKMALIVGALYHTEVISIWNYLVGK